MVTPERSLFSLSILSAVTHAEWIKDSRVFILFILCPEFPCGTNKVAPEFGSDFFWMVVPLFLVLLILFSFTQLLIFGIFQG
jgi:hypothetical protein